MIRWEVPCFGQRRADLGDQDVSSCNLLGGPIWDHLGGLRFKRWSGSLSHTRPVQPQARASGVPSSARNWNALQYASVELRRDAELCLEAVQQCLGSSADWAVQFIMGGEVDVFSFWTGKGLSCCL